MAITPLGKITNSTDSRDSRYVQGGTTDRYSNRLGWWERRELPKSYDDLSFTISPELAGRPDQIAYRFYKKDKLAWLVLQYNNIVDIEEELAAGKTIILPSPQRVLMGILTQSTGGNVISS